MRSSGTGFPKYVVKNYCRHAKKISGDSHRKAGDLTKKQEITRKQQIFASKIPICINNTRHFRVMSTIKTCMNKSENFLIFFIDVLSLKWP